MIRPSCFVGEAKLMAFRRDGCCEIWPKYWCICPFGYGERPPDGSYWGSSKVPAIVVCLSREIAFPAPLWSSKFRGRSGSWGWFGVCVVFYSAYTFPNRKVKSGVGELREESLGVLISEGHDIIQYHNNITMYIMTSHLEGINTLFWVNPKS